MMEKIKLNLPGEDNFLVTEAYKVLRTNLQFCGQDVKVIAFTSCNENEGKTTVTLSIAKSFEELGKKVLVIDADMRKSVMAGRNTNVRNAEGLSEVLTGLSDINDCIFLAGNSMQILLSGKYPPNPVELLEGVYFERLIENARKCYDYVFIDTPPLGPVIDAAVIAKHCDGVVLVLGDDKLSFRQAKSVVDQLRKTGCKILGAVRNNVTNKRKSGYYYSRKKGKGYYYSSEE